MFYTLTYPLRHPSRLILWSWQKPRKITPIGVYVGIVMALSYRPGHPWAGIVGGIEALAVVFLIVYAVAVRAQYLAAHRRG